MLKITQLILLIFPLFLAAQSGRDSIDYYKKSYHEIKLLPKNINSDKSEVSPHRYAKRLYFSRLPSQDSPGRVFTQLAGYPAQPFELKPKDATQHLGFTALTNTGQRIYYTLYRQNAAGDIYKSQIWFHDKDFNGNWKAAKQLPRSFVDNGKNVKYPATGILLDTRSDVLFFISDDKIGKGKDDIWCSYLEKDGSFSPPLQFPYNSEEAEAAPFFDIANQTLYFSSKGHQSYGGFDIFRSHYMGEGKWTKPENLGRPVNSYYDDLFFNFNEKGFYCYFSSDRPYGDCPPTDPSCRNFNIYQIDLKATLQVFLFDEQDKSPLYGCNVELKDLATGEIVSTYLNLEDNFATVGLAPGKEYQLIISKMDYKALFEDVNADELDIFKTSFLELRLHPLKMKALKVSQPTASEVVPLVSVPEPAQPALSPVNREALSVDTTVIAYTELVEKNEPATGQDESVGQKVLEAKQVAEPVSDMPTFAVTAKKRTEEPSIGQVPEEPLIGKGSLSIDQAATPEAAQPEVENEIAEEWPRIAKDDVAALSAKDINAILENKPEERTITHETIETTEPDKLETTPAPINKELNATAQYLQLAATLFTSYDAANYLPMTNMPQISLAKNEDPVDLLFYHKKLQCQIAFDFKNRDFQPDGTDTMNRYLTAIDGLLKKDQNPPIGITFFNGPESQFVVYSFQDGNAKTDEPAFIHTFLFPEHYQGVLPGPAALIGLMD